MNSLRIVELCLHSGIVSTMESHDLSDNDIKSVTVHLFILRRVCVIQIYISSVGGFHAFSKFEHMQYQLCYLVVVSNTYTPTYTHTQ